MEDSTKIPEIVYKYRDWSTSFHRRVLTHNEIFLSSPAEFNDPFDCKIPPNYTSLDTDEKIRAFVDKSAIQYFELLDREGRNIEDEMKILEKKLKSDIQKLQLDYETGWFQFQEERMGIFSLSQRWDSILMWSHYSNKHKGICIGFYEEKLRESGIFGRGSQVSYNPSEDYPVIDLIKDDTVFKFIMGTNTKAYDWHYEEEYRLFKSFYDKVPTTEERIANIKDEVFAEVIIGLNTSESDANEIASICNAKNIKVYKVEKVPFKFMLSRKSL